MRYLRGSHNWRLTYKRCESGIVGFADADWAADVDLRRSVSGYVFILAGGAITWKSCKQPTVSLSITEAEYITLAAAVQEAIWLRQLCNELKMTAEEKPTVIYCDNQSALKLATCSGYRPRTRHTVSLSAPTH